MKAGKQRNVRYPEWMETVFENLITQGYGKNRSEVIVGLLESRLNYLGYKKTDYEFTDDQLMTPERKRELAEHQTEISSSRVASGQ